MVDDQVAELVRRAYEGEVLGVALFGRLVGEEPDRERARRLFAVQLLEEQTLGAARRLADDLGVAVSDGDAAQIGAGVADALLPMAWPERMRAVSGATGGYRDLYEQLEAATGVAEHASVGQLRAHERALHRFAAAEADGDRNAVEHLLAELDAGHRGRFDAFGR